MQTSSNKQVRFEQEGQPNNMKFNLSPKRITNPILRKVKTSKTGRNERINVVYQGGIRKDNVKFKTVKEDIESGRCVIVNY